MTNKKSVFPSKGRSWEEIAAKLEEFKSLDTDEAHGRLTIHMHKGSEEVHRVCMKAYMSYFHGNAMLAQYEMGLKQMQEEILSMAIEIMNGGEEARANITSGGTESIFCALHAAREWARKHRPEVKEPEVIIPHSGHAAFDKSCHYLGMTITRVPVGDDYRADTRAMEAAITSNTIVLVGSAPCWPYGTIDPISELAEIAEKHHLWMHSDCCVGGYISPWLERLGHPIPPYDFRVPGVFSISADLHKHAYAAKPCSTVLFRSEELQQHHWVAVEDWPVGYYRTQSLTGSRPAGAVAAAWAVMKYLGEEGYVALARRSVEVKKRLVEGIEAIEDFRCISNDSLLILFKSEKLDMLCVIGGMVEKGYFPFGTFAPLLIQMCAEPVADEVVDAYLSDLREVSQGVKAGTITAQALAKYA